MEEYLLTGKTLLVVDDENDLRDIVASELEFMGARVFQAENITNAQKILNTETIDLVISDIRMPGGTGIDLLDFIKKRNVAQPPIILITGFADITLEDALNKGAEALMSKPFKLDELIKMAAKYTSSEEERFSEKGLTPTRILKSDSLGDCILGRGGISLSIDLQGQKFSANEVIEVQLTKGEIKVEGIAICRWFKALENSPKAALGLEFVCLKGDSLKTFLDAVNTKKIVPFIPAFSLK